MRTTIFPILCSLALNGSVAFGQTPSFNVNQKYKMPNGAEVTGQSLLDKAFKDLGVDGNSRHVKAFIAGRGYGTTRAKSGYKPTVAKHYKGSAGISFASRGDIDSHQKKILEENMPDIEGYAKDHYNDLMDAVAKDSLEYKEVPRCKSSSTQKVRAGKEDIDPLKTVQQDLLILPDTSLSEFDPLELFGRKVQILEVDQENKELPYQMANSLNFKCLPGRVRITKEFMFVHFGEDALKNYDDDPHGVGKLDERIK